MLRAILNKSWRKHPTKHQLYGHQRRITKIIKVRRTRHAGHYWRSRDELVSDVLLWTPSYGRAKAGRPVWTYIQQLCEDAGCNPEGLSEAMNDGEEWQERVRDIHAGSTTWWGWWWRSICVVIKTFKSQLNVVKFILNFYFANFFDNLVKRFFFIHANFLVLFPVYQTAFVTCLLWSVRQYLEGQNCFTHVHHIHCQYFQYSEMTCYMNFWYVNFEKTW